MTSPELDDLLDAYFLGAATDVQLARLEELLRADVDGRRRFVDAALLEARLHGAFATPAVGRVETASVSRRRETKPDRGIFRLPKIGMRRFDLAASAVVVAAVIGGYYAVRVGFAPSEKIGADAPQIEAEQATVEPQPDVAVQKAEGKIKTVDAKTATFVVVLDRVRRATFHVAAGESSERTAAEILLDGRPTTFDDAIQPRRRAVVTFATDQAGEAWARKVEVTSESR